MAFGFTVAVKPVAPFEYEYVDAPLGVMVNTCKLQILPLATAMVGLANTDTLETATKVFTHPAEDVPLTV